MYEELMLLALKDEQGTVAADETKFTYTVAASFLAELLMAKRIKVVGGKKKLVELERPTPLGDPILDECLEKVKSAKRRASLTTWVSRFARLKKLKHRIAGQLVDRRILRASQDTVLLIFTRKIYPELDPKPERELIERLRKAIFGGGREVDPRTTLLVSLADKAGVLKNAFDKKRLRDKKARIKEIGKGEVTAAAAGQAIEAVQAALVVAVMIPAMAATTASS